GKPLTFQKINCMRIRLTEQRYKHVATIDFALPRSAHVHDGTLHYALTRNRLYRFGRTACRQLIELLIEKRFQIPLELIGMRSTTAGGSACRFSRAKHVQQMFEC